MLTAILRGKRTGSGLAGGRLEILNANGAEDILTATVFERLGYLPSSFQTIFLNELLSSNRLEDVGDVEDIKFWPRWELDGGSVEPDLVIYCTNCSIIVEAKRYDNSGQQDARQLADEVLAGLKSGKLMYPPILLTIGGLTNYSDSMVSSLFDNIAEKLSEGDNNKFDLICRSWQNLLECFQSLSNHIQEDQKKGFERLKSDIEQTYEWHGLRTRRFNWLSSFKEVNTSIKEYTFPKLQLVHKPRNTLHTLKSCMKDIQSYGIKSDFFIKE